MGQYYIIVNLDKKEFIYPHRFGDGLKLLEFGSSGEGTMLGLAILLAHGNNRGGGDLHSENPIIGSWAGDRIIITGDYDDEINEKKFTEKELIFIEGGDIHGFKNLYMIIGEDQETENPEWKDISCSVLEAMLDDEYIKKDYQERYHSNNFLFDKWPENLINKLKETNK